MSSLLGVTDLPVPNSLVRFDSSDPNTIISTTPVTGLAAGSVLQALDVLPGPVGNFSKGALFGFAVVWIPFGLGYKLIRGRTGMGLGDAKLVMMAGAWFGWKGAVFTLLAGAVSTIIGVPVAKPTAVATPPATPARSVAPLSPPPRIPTIAPARPGVLRRRLPR